MAQDLIPSSFGARPDRNCAEPTKRTVCTGGIFENTKQFVRLYPIQLRYLDDEHVFKKYRWIEAYVRKAIRDARPESYNIRCDDIAVGETIPTDAGWRQRAEWVLQPDQIFQSVEALQAAWQEYGTSIGMVKPLAVTDYRVEPYSAEERQQFWTKYQTTYFFLGNIAAHPHKFTIVGLWYPKQQPALQATLFD